MAGKKEPGIFIEQVQTKKFGFCILGTEPLICNRMSQKAMRDLLFPPGRKSTAAKAASLKHDPMREFKDSPYLTDDPAASTYIQHLASAFKKAISGAALDMPGSSKSQIGRLTWVKGERVPIYGIPQLFMSVTRNSDINHTPDVRTRAIVRDWASIIEVEFVTPNLKLEAVSNLLASAGLTQGLGDWRPQKGAGTYGQFKIVPQSDARFAEICRVGGRDAQIQAMRFPTAYDDESRTLLEWYDTEVKRKGFQTADDLAEGGEYFPTAAPIPEGRRNGIGLPSSE